MKIRYLLVHSMALLAVGCVQVGAADGDVDGAASGTDDVQAALDAEAGNDVAVSTDAMLGDTIGLDAVPAVADVSDTAPSCQGVNCDDSNTCTEDTCAAGACAHTPKADHTMCTKGLSTGVCSAGTCSPCIDDVDCATTVLQLDPKGCVTGYCTPGGCLTNSQSKSGQACGACGEGVCSNGQCGGGMGGCSDNNSCTMDYCDSATATCKHAVDPGLNGQPCGANGGSCQNGACVPPGCPTKSVLFESAQPSAPSISADWITFSAAPGLAVSVTGLGIVGGSSDALIDNGESLQVDFAVPVGQVQLLLRAPAGQVASLASPEIQALNALGQPVAVADVTSSGPTTLGGDFTFLFTFVTPVTRLNLTLPAISPSSKPLALHGLTADAETYFLIDFRNKGTCGDGSPACAVTQATVTSGDATVTGNAAFYLLPLNGLGVMGGSADTLVDSQESVTMDFAKPIHRLRLQAGLYGPATDPWMALTNAAQAPIGTYNGTAGMFGKWLDVIGATQAALHANATAASTAGWNLGYVLYSRCENQ